MNVEEKTKNIQELKKLLNWYIDCASNGACETFSVK